MKNIPDVSIAMTNFNSSHLINEAFESILDTAGDIVFDVTIVDDVSTDGGFTLVDQKFKEDQRFRLIALDKHVGYSALNDACKGQGTYLMTFDTDARLWGGAMQALLKFMDEHPEAGAATANLRNPDGSIQNYHRRLMTPRHAFFTTVFGRFFDKYFLKLRNYNSYHYTDLDTSKIFEIEQPPMACLMLRRTAIGSSLLDPMYKSVFLDVDLCRRIYDLGYKIFLVPEANATHIKSVAFGKKTSAFREISYYRDLGAYIKKHYSIWFPIMSFVLWLDRITRVTMRSLIGREPIR